MSETANIAAMAEILSTSLLGTFGWNQYGPINFNFQDDTDATKSRRAKYPCDIIFGIHDAYLKKPVYLLTDLKSYGRTSIESKDKLQSAINGLASALRCARKSNKFRTHLPEDSGSINALLFIFNNDFEFDKDFPSLLASKSPSIVDIPHNSHLYVMGPPQIQFLSDIVNDLQKIHGEDTPTAGAFKFFHPNLISRIPERNEWSSASPEILLSSFITVIYEKEVRTSVGDQIHINKEKFTNIYYRGTGATPEEFCFILDYCFRYSLIDDYQKIKIKMSQCDPEFSSNFDKATRIFSEHFYKQDSSFEKLRQIEIVSIPSATLKFHENQIGMEKRKEFPNAD